VKQLDADKDFLVLHEKYYFRVKRSIITPFGPPKCENAYHIDVNECRFVKALLDGDLPYKLLENFEVKPIVLEMIIWKKIFGTYSDHIGDTLIFGKLRNNSWQDVKSDNGTLSGTARFHGGPFYFKKSLFLTEKLENIEEARLVWLGAVDPNIHLDDQFVISINGYDHRFSASDFIADGWKSFGVSVNELRQGENTIIFSNHPDSIFTTLYIYVDSTVDFKRSASSKDGKSWNYENLAPSSSDPEIDGEYVIRLMFRIKE
jgi:hypothetical protein